MICLKDLGLDSMNAALNIPGFFLNYKMGLKFVAKPKTKHELISLPAGSEDLIQANLLPKLQRVKE